MIQDGKKHSLMIVGQQILLRVYIGSHNLFLNAQNSRWVF